MPVVASAPVENPPDYLKINPSGAVPAPRAGDTVLTESHLLFERGGSVDMVIEIKRSTAPTLSRGFNLARQALKPREAYLVHGGAGSWPMPDGVNAIGLRELMRRLADS